MFFLKGVRERPSGALYGVDLAALERPEDLAGVLLEDPKASQGRVVGQEVVKDLTERVSHRDCNLRKESSMARSSERRRRRSWTNRR
jgi:hypothetical protein